MTTGNLARFKNEINSFFALVVLNLVFGAIAMGFGMQYFVASVIGVSGVQAGLVLTLLTGALAMVSFGLGFGWILFSLEDPERDNAHPEGIPKP